ncbi:MAG: Na+/H+ antiporter NhaC family protein [Eggerthellales bacterium]|nr:Na+/H+ antiporter NhaC family protein [Eggerthellales bacterium]
MTERVKKPIMFRHGMLAFALLALVMFGCVVGLGSEPQIPMVIGCAIAGIIAAYLGFSWEEILDCALKGIMDSMEAVLILMCIGMMVGTWILSGTVPTLIYYGLSVISPALFLPIAFLATLLVGIVLGSWGAAGTIGIAFMGIAAALGVPLPMAAGAIIAGAYVSEIASPLTDGPNLCAAVARVGVFDLCKRFLPIVLIVCLGCCAIYWFMGNALGLGGSAETAETTALLDALSQSFNIGPLTLIPLVVMIVCIAMQVPAIPAFLVAVLLGVIEAVVLQGADLGTAIAAANTGVVSTTGFENIDTLLSTGGIEEMLPTISIVILVMAYGGIMQNSGLLEAMVEPIVTKLKSFGSMVAATVVSGTVLNVLLPDQYPAITMNCQVYGPTYEKRGVPGNVWSNLCNSSAGITSVLVPWNTCAIYMVTILGVACIEYLPFALFCWMYPLVVMVLGLFLGKPLGWNPGSAAVQDASSDAAEPEAKDARTHSANPVA